jgi:probable addiction module antidote protein
MPLETTHFDPAEFLDTAQSQMELLQDALETGNAKYISHALNTVVRAQNMNKIAKDAGLSRSGVYKAFGQDGNPRLSTLLTVLNSLGVTLSLNKAQTTQPQL